MYPRTLKPTAPINRWCIKFLSFLKFVSLSSSQTPYSLSSLSKTLLVFFNKIQNPPKVTGAPAAVGRPVRRHPRAGTLILLFLLFSNQFLPFYPFLLLFASSCTWIKITKQRKEKKKIWVLEILPLIFEMDPVSMLMWIQFGFVIVFWCCLWLCWWLNRDGFEWLHVRFCA